MSMAEPPLVYVSFKDDEGGEAAYALQQRLLQDIATHHQQHQDPRCRRRPSSDFCVSLSPSNRNHELLADAAKLSISRADLVVILTTPTYGAADSGARFSSLDELRFIYGTKKTSIVLVHMCSELRHPYARCLFRLMAPAASALMWVPTADRGVHTPPEQLVHTIRGLAQLHANMDRQPNSNTGAMDDHYEERAGNVDHALVSVEASEDDCKSADSPDDPDADVDDDDAFDSDDVCHPTFLNRYTLRGVQPAAHHRRSSGYISGGLVGHQDSHPLPRITSSASDTRINEVVAHAEPTAQLIDTLEALRKSVANINDVMSELHELNNCIRRHGAAVLPHLVVDYPSIDTVTALMLVHPGHHDLQRVCCSILRHVAAYHHRAAIYSNVPPPAPNDAVQRVRGILHRVLLEFPEVCLTAMWTFQGDAKLQKHACQTLDVLVHAHADHCKRVLRHGGVSAVISAMQMHPRQRGIQRACCRILTRLLQGGHLTAYDAVEDGVLEVLQETLLACISSSSSNNNNNKGHDGHSRGGEVTVLSAVCRCVDALLQSAHANDDDNNNNNNNDDDDDDGSDCARGGEYDSDFDEDGSSVGRGVGHGERHQKGTAHPRHRQRGGHRQLIGGDWARDTALAMMKAVMAIGDPSRPDHNYSAGACERLWLNALSAVTRLLPLARHPADKHNDREGDAGHQGVRHQQQQQKALTTEHQEGPQPNQQQQQQQQDHHLQRRQHRSRSEIHGVVLHDDVGAAARHMAAMAVRHFADSINTGVRDRAYDVLRRLH
ncbi:hypothetical protein PTSG_10451 [Salpingoeca rosetta]|uniref:Uncharacterized protein n=1 Tax=Salpingoeca rosetta (strain ATCC 50818 / BSB-021) TaxID=946362 RepID=F2UPP8_SALR5|nr:uncharacterized protein PTSG_10451 [Salpingoeca rosetta]EGD79603.1 hypothetical protein PTSG_10451 [Salpingoeca rosetta]|eukprot:XP_004988831.1 hypothetical protein PTSG_10451 [Salpingoeca rosetta]